MPQAMPTPRRRWGADAAPPLPAGGARRHSLAELAVVQALRGLLDAAFEDGQRAHANRQRLLRSAPGCPRGRCCAAATRPGPCSSACARRVDHALGGELGLGRAEATERARRDVVGVDGVAIHADVGDLIAAGGEERGDFGHLDAGGGVGAAVGDRPRPRRR